MHCMHRIREGCLILMPVGEGISNGAVYCVRWMKREAASCSEVGQLINLGGPRAGNLAGIEETQEKAKMREGAPSCFFGESGGGSRAVQTLVSCAYQAKFGGRFRMITVSWCKNAMGQGLCVAVDDVACQSICRVDLKPLYFWRRQGSKRLDIDGSRVGVFWDLAAAKFARGPEPKKGYYVAVVCEEQLVLLLGDMREEAYRKTKSRPNASAIEASLLSRKVHVFGKKCFDTKAQFAVSENWHEVSVEYDPKGTSGDAEMLISIDRELAIEVKPLLWKFRGNHTICVGGVPVQIFWDVHDWLFNPGVGHAIFIFKPGPLACHSEPSIAIPSDFCLLLYAWKFD